MCLLLLAGLRTVGANGAEVVPAGTVLNVRTTQPIVVYSSHVGMQLVFPDGTTEAQDLLMLDDGGTTITQIETPEPATLLLVGGGMSALARRRVKGRRIA